MTYENPYMNGQTWPELNILQTLRQRNPLVICITNDVVKTSSSMHRRYSSILVLLHLTRLVTTKRP